MSSTISSSRALRPYASGRMGNSPSVRRYKSRCYFTIYNVRSTLYLICGGICRAELPQGCLTLGAADPVAGHLKLHGPIIIMPVHYCVLRV